MDWKEKKVENVIDERWLEGPRGQTHPSLDGGGQHREVRPRTGEVCQRTGGNVGAGFGGRRDSTPGVPAPASRAPARGAMVGQRAARRRPLV